MHLHNTHINTTANTYADILNTNKEHTLTPISASNTDRGWENNELGLHLENNPNHSQAVLKGKQVMIPKITPSVFVLTEYYKT